MIQNFPEPPSETFFEVQEIGLGWLKVCLIDKENEQIVISATVGRPNLYFYNIVSNVDQDSVDDLKNYEISQEASIKATAKYLIEEYEKLKNLDEKERKLIEKVKEMNQDLYIGKYM